MPCYRVLLGTCCVYTCADIFDARALCISLNLYFQDKDAEFFATIEKGVFNDA